MENASRKVFCVFFMPETITETRAPETEVDANGEVNIHGEHTSALSERPRRKGTALMGALLNEVIAPGIVGDLVEGTVIAVSKAAVYVDLHPFGTGIIYGREFLVARDVIRKVAPGDKIAAKIVDTDNPEGYIELSLKEARQALLWADAEEMVVQKTILDLPVKDANKGGLILEWQGIQGFLPASQLKAEHYPRVEDADKDKILEALKKFVGTSLSVSILSALPKEGKLIFSEKSGEQQEKQLIIDRYNVGDEADGTVTGIVDFGVFVKLEEGLEGLVHISEIDWALVEDPRKLFSVGQKVRVKVIEIKDGKISLSIKALKENPWHEAEKKYKKGDRVAGVIIKYNKHGALASIEEGVAGLVHISEFESEENLRATLELGKTYPFVITLFDAKDQRMALSYGAAKEQENKKESA